MRFEWDPRKASINLDKHDVAFEVAELVWNDTAHIIVFDRHEAGEDRWHAIGFVRGVTILTVNLVYRDRNGDEMVRIIGARKATRAERERYEAQDD